MTQPVRVLHVLNELRPSGAERMLRTAAPVFREVGVACDILSTGQVVGAYAGALEEAGCRVHHLQWSRSPAFFAAVARLTRRGGYDVVHLHAERSFFACVVALRLAGVKKLVRTVHNNFDFRGALRFRRGVERRMAQRLGVRFIAIAPGVDGTERRCYGTSPVLIPNWFDSAQFQPVTVAERAAARAALGIAEHEYTLATVGNCSETKNHTALIAALAGCADRPWRYLHLGQETADQAERAQARALGLADRVHFLGAVDDVRPLLHAADLYVMPSRFEGFSIAVLEALAMGLPALLADVPGLADVRQYVDGVSYSAPDAASLAAALQQAMARGPGLDAAGPARSAAVHGTFGTARGVRDYCRVYAELLGGGMAPART